MKRGRSAWISLSRCDGGQVVYFNIDHIIGVGSSVYAPGNTVVQCSDGSTMEVNSSPREVMVDIERAEGIYANR
jgi:hypothetical protein